MYKTRTCGCCSKWVDHMKANGFDVKVTDVPSTAEYRQKYGVPENFLSCHTAVVKGYSIEGHVPAADVHRLLKTAREGQGTCGPGYADRIARYGARPTTRSLFCAAIPGRRNRNGVPEIRCAVAFSRAESRLKAAAMP